MTAERKWKKWKEFFGKPKQFEPDPLVRKSWPIPHTKGKICEYLVAKMFIGSGWKLYPFGHESIFPDLNIDSLQNRQTLNQIRLMPDFFGISPSGKAVFIEVKYRAKSTLERREINKYFRLWSPLIIILASLDKPYFTVYEKEILTPTALWTARWPFFERKIVEKYAKNLNGIKKFEKAKPFG